jgi:hypothetical protein
MDSWPAVRRNRGPCQRIRLPVLCHHGRWHIFIDIYGYKLGHFDYLGASRGGQTTPGTRVVAAVRKSKLTRSDEGTADDAYIIQNDGYIIQTSIQHNQRYFVLRNDSRVHLLIYVSTLLLTSSKICFIAPRCRTQVHSTRIPSRCQVVFRCAPQNLRSVAAHGCIGSVICGFRGRSPCARARGKLQ